MNSIIPISIPEQGSTYTNLSLPYTDVVYNFDIPSFIPGYNISQQDVLIKNRVLERFKSVSFEKGPLRIEAVDPRSLSDEDFLKIQEVNQDMWARGLGEFLECSDCKYIASKFDIFGEGKLGVNIEKYKKSVKQIMDDLGCYKFPCPHCNNHMDEIYGTEYVNDIKSRLLDTKSFLTLCKFNNTIVGYMDFFISSLEDSYERDWERHYEAIGFQEIKNRVIKILGYLPNEVFCFTAMGLLEENNNFFTIFQLLNIAAQSVPEKYYSIPGISELDKNNQLYGIYKIMGGISLGITEDIALGNRLMRLKSSYASDLVLSVNPIETFSKNFSIGIRSFLRQYGTGLNIQ